MLPFKLGRESRYFVILDVKIFRILGIDRAPVAVAFLIPLVFGIWLDLGLWPFILPRQLLVNSSGVLALTLRGTDSRRRRDNGCIFYGQ